MVSMNKLHLLRLLRLPNDAQRCGDTIRADAKHNLRGHDEMTEINTAADKKRRQLARLAALAAGAIEEAKRAAGAIEDARGAGG
jgi:hypothetical protein